MRLENYAIAGIAGQQIIMEPGKKIKVPRLDQEAGATFVVKNVLYLRNGETVEIGNPFIENVSIDTTIVEHARLKKVIVFKKKRRKGYQKKNGHRQQYTVMEVGKFGAPVKKQAKKAAAKAQPAPVTEKTEESKES